MYMTIQETAEYLGMPVQQVQKYVWEGRIRAVHDGEQYIINQNQFGNYFNQLEMLKKQIEDYLNEPIPPDRDIKDED
ncbi:helix-turn-helix domain-containing protein [Sporosarcina highlanderae]|uniref:Helix-turn-helix domain-containing protein n=1 Tax=Sporosarcina highlanderae TaxID=3035916 RepID=A0ABT8JM72_9BACL|nr:helix-turn-helix domain-containing protein [Sporosarcina highlanderae]MDN4606235.1 helix-turn-helix domain-containing protein [Sporosarcina highlanderae]